MNKCLELFCVCCLCVCVLRLENKMCVGNGSGL